MSKYTSLIFRIDSKTKLESTIVCLFSVASRVVAESELVLYNAKKSTTISSATTDVPSTADHVTAKPVMRRHARSAGTQENGDQ